MIVHRLLAACLGIAPLPDDLKATAGVSEIADGINRRHRQVRLYHNACMYVCMCVCVCASIGTCMPEIARETKHMNVTVQYFDHLLTSVTVPSLVVVSETIPEIKSSARHTKDAGP